jgi:hypothetical protein
VFYKLFYDDVLLCVFHGADSVAAKFYGEPEFSYGATLGGTGFFFI